MKSIDGIIKNPTPLKVSADVRLTQKIRNVSTRVANETMRPVARQAEDNARNMMMLQRYTDDRLMRVEAEVQKTNRRFGLIWQVIAAIGIGALFALIGVF